jgi:hypothetical protein
VKVRLRGTINQDHVVNPKRTTKFNYNYTLGADDLDVAIAVFDRDTGRKLATYTQTVVPHKYVEVNTRTGFVEVVGGHGEPQEFDVKVIGVGIDDSDMLEETDTGLPAGMSGKLFRGEVSANSTDSQIINFNLAESVEVTTTKKAQFVVNGSNKGRSTSFRYTSLAGGEFFRKSGRNLMSNRDYITRMPGVSVKAGPTSRVGGLRRRTGMGNILSNFSSLVERFTR